MSNPIYEERNTLSHRYALAKANRVYLSEFRKSKKAILMREANQKLTDRMKESYAYSHPDYLELLEGLKHATEEEALCYHLIATIDMKFESWRTKESTKRAEMVNLQR